MPCSELLGAGLYVFGQPFQPCFFVVDLLVEVVFLAAVFFAAAFFAEPPNSPPREDFFVST